MSMDLSTLETLGQIAGVAGVAIGVFLFITRDLIAKNIFPKLTKAHSTKIIVMFAFMAWSVALAGIGAWSYTEVNRNGTASDAALPDQKTVSIPGETG